MINYEEIVKNKIKTSRYEHSIRVMNLALKLGEHYNENLEDIRVAALLHDYSKYESNQDILNIYKTTGKDIPLSILKNPNLGHGYMAAIVCKRDFNINDNVFRAIENHTFGRRNMTTLEKIIYLADATEENRRYKNVEKIRRELFVDLDKALFLSAKNTLEYLLSKNLPINENTLEMYNWLLEG